MSTTPEFIAAELEAGCFGPSMVQNENALRIKAAAELRRLAQVEQYADTLNARCVQDTAELGAVRAERDQLRAEAEALKQKGREDDLMAECMVLFRADMIEAGIVTKATPPMFMTEGVLGAFAKLRAESDAGWTEVKRLAGERDRLTTEVVALRRGEFICGKCGLRKDADATGPVPF